MYYLCSIINAMYDCYWTGVKFHFVILLCLMWKYKWSCKLFYVICVVNKQIEILVSSYKQVGEKERDDHLMGVKYIYQYKKWGVHFSPHIYWETYPVRVCVFLRYYCLFGSFLGQWAIWILTWDRKLVYNIAHICPCVWLTALLNIYVERYAYVSW